MSAGGQINWDSIAPRADAGAVNWDSVAPRATEASQHVQGHPLKGQNFGDWLSEELLSPVVSAATQLGRGMQGLGHPEQRPLAESAKDVLTGGTAITAPFAMGGLGGKEAPSPVAAPRAATAPSALGSALKGAATTPGVAADLVGLVSPRLAHGIRIAQRVSKAAQAFRNAGEEAAAPPAPTPTPAAPTEDEQMLEAIKRGQQNAATQAAVPPKAYSPRPPEYYGVKAAEAPPTNPAPSAPAPAPAPAASSTMVEASTTTPEASPEASTPKSAAANIAKAAQAADKGRRFADAVQKYRQAHPDTDWVQSTDFLEGWANDAVKSKLTRNLIKEGYLPNHETFSDTSWPYMIQRLRAAEAPTANR